VYEAFRDGRNHAAAGLPLRFRRAFSQDAEKLIGLNDADASNRIGRIWLVFTRSPLRTSGVKYLLKYWGGEALWTALR
jgi:hypothetical protein